MMDRFDAQQKAECNRWSDVQRQREDLYAQLAALRIKYESASSRAKKDALWDQMQQAKTALNALDLCR